jgi:signal transduction histidine kinase
MSAIRMVACRMALIASARQQPGSSEEATTAPRRSLYSQVRLARIWLPLAIVGVVLAHQLTIVPLGGPSWRFWSQLLFYIVLGPIATYVTLTWIASEVRSRERAQVELQRLFRELQDAYAVLGALQRVTEQFASAPDLEHAVAAASRGVREATGARLAAVVVGSSVVSVHADDAQVIGAAEHAALGRDAALARAGGSDAIIEEHDGATTLALPLRWGGKHEGSLQATFDVAPDDKQRETLRILAADFAAAAEAVQGRTRDLLTLFEVDRSIRAEGNLARLLSALVSRMAARVGAQRAGVYLSDDDGTLELRAAVRQLAEGFEPWHPPPMPIRRGEGLVGRAAVGREPLVLSALADAERRASGPLLEGAGSAVLLPLSNDERLLGVIVLAHDEPGRGSDVSLPFLGLLAGQLSLAVANASAYLQSEELAIVEERNRIAREIHDGVAQSLAFAGLKLDLIGRLLERDPSAAQHEVQAVRSTVREMIREIRRSIFALRPVDLERYGFVETLRRYAVDYGQQNDILVELHIPPLPELSLKSEAILFRIFQEAMNNVAKHAAARTVTITLEVDPAGTVAIEIADDGLGFDPGEVEDRVTSAGGLGLRQMRERVESRGGRFEVSSEPGEGTRIAASMPA